MGATNIMPNPRNGKLGTLNKDEDEDDDDDEEETISMARTESRSAMRVDQHLSNTLH